MSVSVLILTLNEEINLPGCLQSVSWSDDIVVFDSYSSDHTSEIGEKAGARVIKRKFDNYANQRNAALSSEFKNSFVLMIDADERVTPEFKNEIELMLQSQSDISLWRVRRKDMFFAKWLKRSSGYPTWFGRLFKVGRVRVEREINEEYHTDGKIGYLKEHLLHYPFNKGINFWLERHNNYSSMEAQTVIKEISAKLHWSHLFSKDPTSRRKFLKQLAFRMPLRPFLVFCYLYLFRLGFLDGIPGYTYCRLRALYEYMIDLKVKELRRRERNLPI